MKTLLCKSDNQEKRDKAEDSKKVIIEKVKRVSPWPEPPIEKKPVPEKDKKESS